MAKKICVIADTFGSLNADVFLVDNENVQHLASVPLNEIKDTVFGLAGDPQRDIDEIKFEGNTTYLSKVCTEITTGLKNFYSNENVRVNLNGKVFN